MRADLYLKSMYFYEHILQLNFFEKYTDSTFYLIVSKVNTRRHIGERDVSKVAFSYP